MRAATSLLVGVFTAAATAFPYNTAVNLETRDTVTAAQLANFKLFAEYAGAAYCANNNDDSGGLITCADNVCPTVASDAAVGITEFLGTSSTDQQGFVAVDTAKKLIVVALRGTDSIVDLIDDLLFLYTSCPFVAGCSVHTGFYNNWLAAQATIVSAVKTATAKYPSYSLVVTGHSLGAAVGTIAAAYLRANGYPCDLYTYGSPRVGNAAFADFVTGQAGITARITHLDDEIPRLPPLLFTYRHTSPEYWLSDGTSTTTNYNITDIKICTGDANVDCNAGQSNIDFTAHDYYLEYITACAPALSIGKRALGLGERTTTVSSSVTSQLESLAALDIAYAAALAAST